MFCVLELKEGCANVLLAISSDPNVNDLGESLEHRSYCPGKNSNKNIQGISFSAKHEGTQGGFCRQ